ncbi:RHS repeat-associated core domain-containing protein [Paracidovorax sp. MALMAid1276]|uniref:RHS repeat-associated core domain-containing protein n=1 Tax=Paracidovorax sp. MALMAid1276 TaxID=3411631 RepID=UPI003B9B477B
MKLTPRAGKPAGATATPGANWNAQGQQYLHDPRFNLLQPEQNPDSPADQTVERWRDNRIGWSQAEGESGSKDNQGTTHYRYDRWGNRTQTLHSDGSTTALHYDSLHQLREAIQIDAQGKVQSTTTYRYDTFGRRVSKTHQAGAQQPSQTTHYGWDGVRLVHTETAEHIHHTVYEPGSFVPLLQVQRSKDKEGQADPVTTLLSLGDSEASNTLDQELPRHEREMLHEALREVLQPGYELSALLPQEMRAQVRESIQALKDMQAQSEEQNPLTIRHVLTDHLGTPIAVINANGEQQGQVAWAARYTAWGEIEEEYNPNQILQPIRFQGQQFDQETKLHYNRFRYYDPRVGQYVTQDPIGLHGGGDLYEYGLNQPLSASDPTGLLAPLAIFGYMAMAGAFSGGAANVVKQKVIEGKCLKDIDLMGVANSTVWGGLGGAAMPLLGSTVTGAMAIGAVTGGGQYITGAALEGAQPTLIDLGVNAGMGAVGGGLGGKYTPPTNWGGLGKWGNLAREAYTDVAKAQNLTPKSIGQAFGGNVASNVDPRSNLPCVTCAPKKC